MISWIQNNVVLATSLIAALSALAGGIIAAAAKFVFDFYLSERIKQRWKIVDTKRRYSAPLIRAAEDLSGRIGSIGRNLSDRAPTRRLRQMSDEEKKDIPFRRYYFSSTVYLFCRLVAWIEILKREQIFLEFSSTKETRKFNAHLELIYSIISYAGLTGTEPDRSKTNHWIFYHYLGGIGESLFKRDENGSLRCLTYNEFSLNYRAEENRDFRSWMSEVEGFFTELSSSVDDRRWERLQILGLCLDEFLDFVDPKELRTIRDRSYSGSINVDLLRKLRLQAKWFGL